MNLTIIKAILRRQIKHYEKLVLNMEEISNKSYLHGFVMVYNNL